MTAKITIVPLNHPVLIRFPEQSDYENNKARIKRISIVVKRFTDEKGYTNALLFKGSQQLVEDVKAQLGFLKIKYISKS